MCGRYSFLEEEDLEELNEMVRVINAKSQGETERVRISTGEIFPTNVAPILLTGKLGHYSPVAMKWGFPRWDNKGVIINARQETISEKSMFKNSFKTKRCIVPASGFYEWNKKDVSVKNTPSDKTKYYFSLLDKSFMSMAGIWNVFKQPDGSLVNSFVILTTEANETVGAYHNRMPVILVGQEREAWLRDVEAASQILRDGNRPELVVKEASAS